MRAMDDGLSAFQWVSLVIVVVLMAYLEGYQGFQKSFSPRSAARTYYLYRNPDLLTVVFAPLFVMGFFRATRGPLLFAWVGTCLIVLLIVVALSERALNSPWGRMMRAIRDNEDAAEAMGKDVTRRHLQIFIIGSAVIGIAGAMLTTLDGQFTPGTYQPLRFTFLIWIMVIIGGSGNNWGSVLGGFLVWFVWIEAEPAGLWLMDVVTSGLAEGSPLRAHLLEAAPHMRLIIMGVTLLLVMRFASRGLIPEKLRL